MSDLDMNAYQKVAKSTAESLTLDHFAYGLLEEAGEVAGILKRFHRGDEDYWDLNIHRTHYEEELSAAAKAKLRAELGDVLWYVAMLANLLDISLSEVAEQNLEKLQDRAKRNVIQGSGDNR